MFQKIGSRFLLTTLTLALPLVDSAMTESIEADYNLDIGYDSSNRATNTNLDLVNFFDVNLLTNMDEDLLFPKTTLSTTPTRQNMHNFVRKNRQNKVVKKSEGYGKRSQLYKKIIDLESFQTHSNKRKIKKQLNPEQQKRQIVATIRKRKKNVPIIYLLNKAKSTTTKGKMNGKITLQKRGEQINKNERNFRNTAAFGSIMCNWPNFKRIGSCRYL